MTSQDKTIGSKTRTVRKQRYWSRTDSPKPWHPWGTAQLLWIGLLFLIGAFMVAPRIEADIRTQVGDRLHAAGIPSATVSANGQSASIRADAGETTEMVVQTIAASTRCRTWAGQLPCPTEIDVTLDAPVNITTALTARPHEFTAVRSDSNVTTAGEVPSFVEQDRILDTAGQHFDVVANEMVITNQPATASYTSATNSASGNHDGCEDKFENALAGRAIQFKTNSAMIDGSEQLLEDLSRIANACPGQLTVEGHTDSRGSAEINKVLSQARADSVLDALTRLGVEADRLVSIGYGEQHPIAGNETTEGRAANRRISISTQSNK